MLAQHHCLPCNLAQYLCGDEEDRRRNASGVGWLGCIVSYRATSTLGNTHTATRLCHQGVCRHAQLCSSQRRTVVVCLATGGQGPAVMSSLLGHSQRQNDRSKLFHTPATRLYWDRAAHAAAETCCGQGCWEQQLNLQLLLQPAGHQLHAGARSEDPSVAKTLLQTAHCVACFAIPLY